MEVSIELINGDVKYFDEEAINELIKQGYIEVLGLLDTGLKLKCRITQKGFDTVDAERAL